jgi:hypothetical protein
VLASRAFKRGKERTLAGEVARCGTLLAEKGRLWIEMSEAFKHKP